MQDTPRTQGLVGGRTAARLAARLRREIAAGGFRGGDFLPSVRELAERHGAAKATVNRALKVLASEGLVVSRPRHGYRVAMAAGEPDLGLPLAYVDAGAERVGGGWDEFSKTLAAEFQRVARARGWSLLTVTAADSAARMLEQITAANCCGVISNAFSGELLDGLRSAGIPVVLADSWREGAEADAVLQSNFHGARRAARWLAGRGHRRVAWLGPGLAEGQVHIVERFGGALGELARLGARLAPQVEAPMGRPEEAAAAARRMLARSSRPTAVLALWQDMTLAMAAAARQLGLAVGKDFEMVGWCTEEQCESGFLSCFPEGQAPPVVTWSIARLAEAAVARLKQRRAEPGLAPGVLRVPTALRAGDGE